MTRTRILIADPLSIVRSGVRRLLQDHADFDVVEAADLAEVREVAAAACPQIALIDLDLPGGGLEAVTDLLHRCPCSVIVWSDDPGGELVLGAINAGASGYLDKTISPAGLLRALRGIEHGQAPISRHLVLLLVEAVHGQQERRDASERFAVLSARERQVLDLVARGARNRQIAEALFISEFTVKRHMQNILRKLGLASRQAAAASYAAAFGSERVGSTA